MIEPRYKVEITTYFGNEPIVVKTVYKTDANVTDKFLRVESYDGVTLMLSIDEVRLLTITEIDS
jgi:hypothetical protein